MRGLDVRGYKQVADALLLLAERADRQHTPLSTGLSDVKIRLIEFVSSLSIAVQAIPGVSADMVRPD